MYYDDYEDDELGPIDDMVRKYEALNAGKSAGMMDEEQFEQVIEHYIRESNEEQALTACERALTFYPCSPSILLLKAEILTQAQKYGQATKALDEMEQYDSHCLDAVLLRSDILLSQYKYDQAALLLEQRVEEFTGKEKVEILLELSDVYDESEEFDAVFDTLKRIIVIEKRNEEALQKICFWAEFTERLDESVTLHTQLTDNDPYNALAWFNLGAAYQGLKLFERSIEAYEFCVAIDEKFEFAYRNMADAFMRLKMYEKALEVLEKHIEIAKAEDVIFEAMGYCWEKRKDYAKARQFYRKASSLSPQDDGLFFKIGETYAREKQWDKAVKQYSQAFNLNKDNAAYCMAIGNCLMELDVKSEALVCFVNAVRLKPGNKGTWLALIRGLYLSGRYAEAVTQVAIAEESCGKKAEFAYTHAASLFQLGKAKEGMLQLENGLRLAPGKLKFFTGLNPEYLLRSAVSDLIGKYKKK